MTKFSVYLNRHVFVMLAIQNAPSEDSDLTQADFKFRWVHMTEGMFPNIVDI